MADDELKAILARLVDKADSESIENGKFRAEIRTELKVITTRLDGIDKRLDEQGRYIAALIPGESGERLMRR